MDLKHLFDELWKHNELEQKKIEREIGFELPRMVGPHVLIMTYIKGLKPKKSDLIMPDYMTPEIIIPENVVEAHAYESYSGTVVAMGNECFRNEKIFPFGPRFKIGDHVLALPGSGPRFKYRNMSVQICYDDKIDIILPDPSFVERC